MDVAQYTAEILRRRGVKYVFGIPGGPSIPYMEAWKAKGIEFILTSHETAAGIMADVTARLTGVPGVCHSTFGPGATNLSTGVGAAFLDRSPLIALTTEVPDRMAGRTTQMGIDHQTLFRPITKATFRLSPENIAGVMDEAFVTALSELPGPVHIGLPSDIAGASVSETLRPARMPESEVDIRRLDEALELIKTARRPLVAAGLTAIRNGAGVKLKEFLARVAVPVVVTPMAKGLIPPDHPCYVGVLFHALSDRLKRITESADLIIGIGYDPVEYNYESWMPDVPVVHFATSNVDMPDSVRAVQVIGPPDSWFDALGRSAIEGDFLSGRGVTGVRQEINEIFRECSGKWGPVAVLKTLREELPAGSVIACDVGSHLHMAGQYWDVYEPGRLIMTNGWSTMGFGLPAAMAASLNKPGTTVAAVTGDGGFLMSAGEIMTARRYNLNVKIIVISDRELNLISVKQSWKDLDPYGTRLMDGNLFDANRFLGVPVLNATSYVSMRKCIGSALNTAGPVIINASVDSADYQRIITRQ